MPIDRRRHGLFRYLLAPLPHWVQGVVADLIPAGFWWWMLALALAVVVSPWGGIGLLIGLQMPQVWKIFAKRCRLLFRHRMSQEAKTIWVVRWPIGWRINFLRWTGVLWLPHAAPVQGGDILLLDCRAPGAPPTDHIHLAARLPDPLFRAGRRRRWLVRVSSCWMMDDPIPIAAIPELNGRSAVPPVVALDPATEKEIRDRRHLVGEAGTLEERKPGWKKERQVHARFHKLWGMAHDSNNYDKPSWGNLQADLRELGVWV